MLFQPAMHGFLGILLVAILGLGQVCTQTSQCTSSLDLVLILDSSDSVTRREWMNITDIVESLVRTLPIDDDEINVGIVNFSADVNIVPMSSNKSALVSGVKTLQDLSAGTRTDLAIQNGTGLLKNYRPETSDVIVIITDGNADFPNKTRAAASLARRSNITIFALGIGMDVKTTDLLDLTGHEHRDRVLHVNGTAYLLNSLLQITDRVCGEAPKCPSKPSTEELCSCLVVECHCIIPIAIVGGQLLLNIGLIFIIIAIKLNQRNNTPGAETDDSMPPDS